MSILVSLLIVHFISVAIIFVILAFIAFCLLKDMKYFKLVLIVLIIALSIGLTVAILHIMSIY
jgi:hypothetical protein